MKLDDVREYYESRLREHGPTPQGVDWNSEASHNTRFDQLTKVLDRTPHAEEFSILDFGCGYGALVPYLSERFSNFWYVGYDISGEMTARAKSLLAAKERPSITLTTDIDSLPVCDFTVASGVFNVRLRASDDEWREHILSTLALIDGRSRRGWAANFLTSYSDPERMTARLFYSDPLFLFDWCKRNVSKWVALLHDYGLHEFTIVVRKDVE
jgi:SAM-dependent methyltransferase